jgi:alginate O-acetyltransferase complex protein AlgI
VLFTEPAFLFGFLPLLLGLHALAPPSQRAHLLLAASFIFYWWGEKLMLPLLIVVAVTWLTGSVIERGRPRAKRYLALGVALQLVLLSIYKYSNFFADTWNALADLLGTARWELDARRLPLGISFFTFQAISYLVDVYRGHARARRSPLSVGLYLAFFPKLTAGPMARYRDLEPCAEPLGGWAANMQAGVPRIVVGLAKKVLLANSLGELVERVAGMPSPHLSPSGAWLGLAAYTLQLYFDFSGYSDMAVGLARLFGFRLPENFNYPLAARSLTDFWRRWHMTLGAFLREYLYIPLGGNRRGPWRTRRNLWLVFLLCGLWHGASWNFVLWGAWQGLFLTLERGRPRVWLERAPRAVSWAYTQLVWLLSMALFKIGDPGAGGSLPDAARYAGCLLGLGGQEAVPLTALVDPVARAALLIGALAAMPVLPAVTRWWERREATAALPLVWLWHAGRLAVLGMLLAAGVLSAAAGANTQFLYRQF